MKLFEIGPTRFPSFDRIRRSNGTGTAMGADIGNTAQGKETDAVISAVRKMQKLRASDSSIMGALSPEQRAEVCKIECLVRAISSDILQNPRDYGPVPIIRWAEFISEWENFKSELVLNDRTANALANTLPVLKAGAISWGQQAIGVINQRERAFFIRNRGQSRNIFAMDSQSPGGPIPWTKVGLIAGGSLLAYWLLRAKTQKGFERAEEQG